jgi:probable rRNA maturation factor
MAAAGVLDLDVLVDKADWVTALPGVEGHCRRAAGAAFERLWRRRQAAEATLVLADDARVASLNRTFRGIDAATNVLSFPATEHALAMIGAVGEGSGSDVIGPPVPLGDMILAYETVEAEAGRNAKSLADHVSHLVVHGILHLLGYDHQTDSEADVMEALETSLLAGLGVADPYAGPHDL